MCDCPPRLESNPALFTARAPAQVNFKNPGGVTTFPFHRDTPKHGWESLVASPKLNYVQTYMLVDAATEANGCLRVLPRSHDVQGPLSQEDLDELDLTRAVPIIGDPGDMLLFNTYAVHGSSLNTTSRPRRAYINGFLRASASLSPDSCEWAFRDGAAVPLRDDYDYSSLRPERVRVAESRPRM